MVVDREPKNAQSAIAILERWVDNPSGHPHLNVFESFLVQTIFRPYVLLLGF